MLSRSPHRLRLCRATCRRAQAPGEMPGRRCCCAELSASERARSGKCASCLFGSHLLGAQVGTASRAIARRPVSAPAIMRSSAIPNSTRAWAGRNVDRGDDVCPLTRTLAGSGAQRWPRPREGSEEKAIASVALGARFDVGVVGVEVVPFLAGEVASGNRAGALQHSGQAYVPTPEPAVLGGDDEVPGAVEA